VRNAESAPWNAGYGIRGAGSCAHTKVSGGFVARQSTAVVTTAAIASASVALGSPPAAVLRFIMSGGARLGAWGLLIGLVGAIAVAKLMEGLLYGLSPSDPLTFAIAPLTLGVVVLVATYLPARRAVRLDPIAALRSE